MPKVQAKARVQPKRDDGRQKMEKTDFAAPQNICIGCDNPEGQQ